MVDVKTSFQIVLPGLSSGAFPHTAPLPLVVLHSMFAQQQQQSPSSQFAQQPNGAMYNVNGMNLNVSLATNANSMGPMAGQMGVTSLVPGPSPSMSAMGQEQVGDTQALRRSHRNTLKPETHCETSIQADSIKSEAWMRQLCSGCLGHACAYVPRSQDQQLSCNA